MVTMLVMLMVISLFEQKVIELVDTFLHLLKGCVLVQYLKPLALLMGLHSVMKMEELQEIMME